MKRIWVDTDIALGAASGDVDDGYALAAVAQTALRRPVEIELLGVSAVSGNTDAKTAQGCARKLLALMRLERAPVVCGDDAAAAIAALPEGSSVLALGPLTNIARAIALDPQLPRRIELRTVGTVLDPRCHVLLPLLDLNMKENRHAAQAVFTAPLRLRRIFPLDVAQRLRLCGADLDAMSKLGAVGAYLADHSRRWLRQAWWRYSSTSFPVWDLVAALDAIGQLPGAHYSEDGSKLIGFAPDPAREAVLDLIRTDLA